MIASLIISGSYLRLKERYPSRFRLNIELPI
jgi:hypothetical protein